MTNESAAAELEVGIKRAYRVKLRLKPAAECRLLRLFGARRKVWNWAMETKQSAWRETGTSPNGTDLSREFTTCRATGDTAWLSELPREPFNQTLRDVDRAWENFFAGRAQMPRRKKFGTVMSSRFTPDQRRDLVDREQGSVQLDGIGRLRFRVTEPIKGRLRSVTIRRDAAGRWFACFSADGVPAPASVQAERIAIGVDLGLKSTAALSDGTTILAPRHLAAKLKRLRRYQRSYSRGRDAQLVQLGLDPKKRIPKGTKVPVSNRMRRRRVQIGRLHAQVADARRDHQHRVTAQVVASAEVVCIEDLSVKGMQRGMGRRAFRRSVGDAGLGEIRRQLEYKAAWAGRVVSVVDRFYPSSKTCSGCGEINRALTLRDRTCTCAGCSETHDRDINAAVNIEREGLRRLAGTCPDGRTPRSGGSKARGADVCAGGGTLPVGQPTAVNRELSYRGATPRPTTGRRDGPRRPVVEG